MTTDVDDLKQQYLKGIEQLIDNNRDAVLDSLNKLINKQSNKLLPINTDDVLASIHSQDLSEEDTNYILTHQVEWQGDVTRIIMNKLNLMPHEGE